MDIVSTNSDLGLLILRLAVGAVFLAHGPSKLTNPKQFANGVGINENMALLVGALETLGALGLITGLWTQISAVFIIVVMLGAIYFKTQKWGKKFTGENGWELDFILIAGALTILFAGAGAYVI